MPMRPKPRRRKRCKAARELLTQMALCAPLAAYLLLLHFLLFHVCAAAALTGGGNSSSSSSSSDDAALASPPLAAAAGGGGVLWRRAVHGGRLATGWRLSAWQATAVMTAATDGGQGWLELKVDADYGARARACARGQKVTARFQGALSNAARRGGGRGARAAGTVSVVAPSAAPVASLILLQLLYSSLDAAAVRARVAPLLGRRRFRRALTAAAERPPRLMRRCQPLVARRRTCPPAAFA